MRECLSLNILTSLCFSATTLANLTRAQTFARVLRQSNHILHFWISATGVVRTIVPIGLLPWKLPVDSQHGRLDFELHVSRIISSGGVLNKRHFSVSWSQVMQDTSFADNNIHLLDCYLTQQQGRMAFHIHLTPPSSSSACLLARSLPLIPLVLRHPSWSSHIVRSATGASLSPTTPRTLRIN